MLPLSMTSSQASAEAGAGSDVVAAKDCGRNTHLEGSQAMLPMHIRRCKSPILILAARASSRNMKMGITASCSDDMHVTYTVMHRVTVQKVFVVSKLASVCVSRKTPSCVGST